MCHNPNADEEDSMDSDQVSGKWSQTKGKIKEQWGQLTDDDLQKAEGDTEYLAGRIQELYGISKDEARKKIEALQK